MRGNPLFKHPDYQEYLRERRRALAQSPRPRRVRRPAPPAPPPGAAEAPAPPPRRRGDDIFAEVDRRIDAHLPELIEVLISQALRERDRQAAMYLVDRRLGRIPDRAQERDQEWLRLIERLAEAREAARAEAREDPEAPA